MTTDKSSCRQLADLLWQHGVRHVFLCPGSRNAPLIVAISRHPHLHTTVVIDERSAAFMALGYAAVKSQPVAIVCTSGSAVLNFAPAIAEAFYRRVPLIVISADRPAEWIDQDDSQTIRQVGILRNIVKESYVIPVESHQAVQDWYINRTINDAMLMAQAAPQGPVHINVHLDAPLGKCTAADYDAQRKISVIHPDGLLATNRARELGREIASPIKTLIIAGFMPPDEKVNRALLRLAAKPNIVVMHEAQANLHGGGRFIGKIDSVLSTLDEEQRRQLTPDVVITIGGSLVSRFVKSWLRTAAQSHVLRHWHIGQQPYSVDCFMGLDLRIDMEARLFLMQMASAVQPFCAESDYSERWHRAAKRADDLDREYELLAPWTDYKAMAMVMSSIPERWNLQLSNGTAVRYAQLFDYRQIHRIDCNRGVSGIDGATSTAIGAAIAYPDTTLLVTGDMSAQYDLGALAANCIPTRFKIVVLNNSGGAIFRFVDSTAQLDEREQYFCADVRLPLRQLALGFGFEYFEANSAADFEGAWAEFARPLPAPAILNLVTPPQPSADLLKAYFLRGSRP